MRSLSDKEAIWQALISGYTNRYTYKFRSSADNLIRYIILPHAKKSLHILPVKNHHRAGKFFIVAFDIMVTSHQCPVSI